MSSNTQDTKLAEALLHAKSEYSHENNAHARWACKGFLVTLLVAGILAVLTLFKGMPTSTSVKEPILFYNASSTWRPPQHDRLSKKIVPQREQFYWSRRKGDLHGSSSAMFTSPSNFASGPSWTWKNDLREQVRHSPLIDNDFNIYIVTTSRIRKLTSDGELLWSWQTTPTEGILTDSPALYKGHIIGVTNCMPPLDRSLFRTTGFSLKTSDGSVNWKHLYPYGRNSDADTMSVFDGTMIFALKRNGSSDVPDLVAAANATDGRFLWVRPLDEVFWNFTPSYADDGTFLFSGTCGAVFRLSLKGELIWKVGPSAPGQLCSEGGGSLGPNGLFYVEWNQHLTGLQPGSLFPIQLDNDGRIAAYQVSDGALVWERRLGRRAGNHPAVGVIDGRLTVVVPVGDQPFYWTGWKAWLYLHLLPTPGYLTNAVWAIDATDGSMIWQSEEPKWPFIFAKYDDKAWKDSRPAWPLEVVCLPDAQGIPLILGDGTVYAASSHGGWLRAIRDVNHNGLIEQSEIQTFSTSSCFLNGPSAAPGMLVAATCWGDVNIFKS